MEQVTLTVEKRLNSGKGANRKLRTAGKLPGVLYGLGQNQSLIVDPRFIHKYLLEEGGRNRVFNLEGADLNGRYCLIKDYAIDPVKRNLLHVDLLEIDVTKKVTITVPLNFTGKAIGSADGGVVSIMERNIHVTCLPTSIPKHIDVDVTPLHIGESIHLDELKLPEGVEKASQFNPTVVTCVPPTKEEEATASLTQAAEPEVITAKKPDADAAAGDAKKDDKKDAKKDTKK